MLIKVLGAAAGGGFPQWNCNGTQSRAVRSGRPGFRAATQSSIAVRATNEPDPSLSATHTSGDWVLLNASPDIREQIAATVELQPAPDAPLRSSPIKAVVLTNGDVDHVAGLLSLREGQAFTLYAHARVLDTLAANPIFNVLNPNVVTRVAMAMEQALSPAYQDQQLGFEITAFDVPGKVALYLEDEGAGANFGTVAGDTIGLEIRDPKTAKRAYYMPACAALTDDLKARIAGADLLMFDGTLFTDTEMLDQGLSQKTGRRMGHMSMSGDDGAIAALRDISLVRRVFIHINNSNPVWDAHSDARRFVEASGWEIAYDGMELEI